MEGTEVLTGKLMEVAKNVEDLNGRYIQAVSKLYQIGDEIDAMWDGEASDKFRATLGDDRVRFEAMSKLLMDYVTALNEDAAIYNKAESDVLDVLSTNKIR